MATLCLGYSQLFWEGRPQACPSRAPQLVPSPTSRWLWKPLREEPPSLRGQPVPGPEVLPEGLQAEPCLWAWLWAPLAAAWLHPEQGSIQTVGCLCLFLTFTPADRVTVSCYFLEACEDQGDGRRQLFALLKPTPENSPKLEGCTGAVRRNRWFLFLILQCFLPFPHPLWSD